jgi:hypothetical protein
VASSVNWPRVTWKLDDANVAQPVIGAPVARRQLVQWQMQTTLGVLSAR